MEGKEREGREGKKEREREEREGKKREMRYRMRVRRGIGRHGGGKRGVWREEYGGGRVTREKEGYRVRYEGRFTFHSIAKTIPPQQSTCTHTYAC